MSIKYFVLYRHEDEGGVSGTGLIAEGVEFGNGKCILNWLTAHTSLGIYDDIQILMDIHGHDGKTVLHYRGIHEIDLEI